MRHFARGGNFREALKGLKLLANSTQPRNMSMLKTNYIYLPLESTAAHSVALQRSNSSSSSMQNHQLSQFANVVEEPRREKTPSNGATAQTMEGTGKWGERIGRDGAQHGRSASLLAAATAPAVLDDAVQGAPCSPQRRAVANGGDAVVEARGRGEQGVARNAAQVELHGAGIDAAQCINNRNSKLGCCGSLKCTRAVCSRSHVLPLPETPRVTCSRRQRRMRQNCCW
jgi:hypothetical protein